jgi:predicted O-methyltransferase YrrM
MLNSLEEPSVIVMDNASYHSTLIDNFPKSNTRKADVQAWLTKKNVDFSPLENLAELRQKVKALKKNMNWMYWHWKWATKLFDFHRTIANTIQLS